MAAGNAGRFGGTVHAGGRAFRSEITLEDPNAEVNRVLQEYTNTGAKYTELFSTSTAEEIFKDLCDYFCSLEEPEEGKEQTAQVKLVQSADSFKFKAVVTKDLGSVEASINITGAGDLPLGVDQT